jgi:hypothetical protein
VSSSPTSIKAPILKSNPVISNDSQQLIGKVQSFSQHFKDGDKLKQSKRQKQEISTE